MEDSRIDLLNQITDDIGYLLGVEYLFDATCPRQLQAIILNFENHFFTVKALPDEDEIELISGKISVDYSGNLISVSAKNPWSKVIGKHLRWSWALINHQGYSDAMQFEFAKDLSDTSVIIQLVTVASSIRVYELKEISSEI